MNTGIKQFIGALALVMMGAGVFAQSLPNVDWLMGDWQIQEDGSFERWEKVEDGYVGKGYKMQGDEEKTWESMKLHQVEGKWVYTVSLGGSTPMDFALTKVEGTKMTFENPENDYPVAIVYWQGESGPMAEISGTIGADETVKKFTFQEKPKKEEAPASDLPAAAANANSPLGSYGVISIGVKDLNVTAEWYEQLGFEMKMMDNAPYPWARVSDGAAMVQLNQDGMEYFGLTYFTDDMGGVEKIARENGYKPFMKQETPVKMVVLVDPDTTFGIAVVQYPTTEKPLPVKGKGKLGTLGEIAVPVSDYDVAAAWYESMGFKNIGTYEKPYKWGIFTDGIMMIGLHQSDHFDKPAITYFSAEAEATIEGLNERGLKVRNAMPDMKQKKLKFGVVDSPDGWPVNIFQGEL